MLTPPRLQIWIQDLLILTIMAGLTLAWRFDRANWESAAFPLFCVGVGFFIAVDLASMWQWGARTRAIVFAAIIAASVVAAWLVPMVWYAWKRYFARWCFFPERRARIVLFIAVFIYALAFLLPMKGAGDAWGYVAYLWCVISFLPTTGSHSSHEEILRAAWMANPCFWAAVAFLSEGRRWLSCICALLAAGLALTVHDSSPGGFAVYNSPGYGTWFFSMVFLAIGSVVIALTRRERE